MTTVVVCDGCEKLIGRPHEALAVHVPSAGLVFHIHDGCFTKLKPKVKAARKAAAESPEALDALRRQHQEG